MTRQEFWIARYNWKYTQLSLTGHSPNVCVIYAMEYAHRETAEEAKKNLPAWAVWEET